MTDLSRLFSMRESKSTLWIKEHFDFARDDVCLIWPFGRSGGGYVRIGFGKKIAVHRIMCEHKNGPAPSQEHQAAHSCGKGTDGCVNQNHLNWRTPSQNQFERFEHQGGIKPRFRITFEQAAQIRALKGIETTDAIAAKFGISAPNVRQIQSGTTWQQLNHRVFTEQEVNYIREMKGIRTSAEIARELGASESAIARVRSGVTYRYFKSAGTLSELSRPLRGDEA